MKLTPEKLEGWGYCMVKIAIAAYMLSRVKTSLDILEQETVSGNDISWAICKSAPCPRQITTPSPTTQFLQTRCPSCQPTNIVKALRSLFYINVSS